MGLSKKLSKNGNSKFFASRKLYKNAFTGKAAIIRQGKTLLPTKRKTVVTTLIVVHVLSNCFKTVSERWESAQD
jgi:hypothetical protein